MVIYYGDSSDKLPPDEWDDTQSANDDATYYNADKIHPNDAGHAALYTLISGVLSPLW